MESKISSYELDESNNNKSTKNFLSREKRNQWARNCTWTWRLFNAAWTALNVLSANDGETLRECGRDAWLGRWGETERGERSLNDKYTGLLSIESRKSTWNFSTRARPCPTFLDNPRQTAFTQSNLVKENKTLSISDDRRSLLLENANERTLFCSYFLFFFADVRLTQELDRQLFVKGKFFFRSNYSWKPRRKRLSTMTRLEK